MTQTYFLEFHLFNSYLFIHIHIHVPVQMCVFLPPLISLAGRSWGAAVRSPCSATSPWRRPLLHRWRCSGFRSQRNPRGKTSRFPRTAKAASSRPWPTTGSRGSTATAATWAWTACLPTATGYESSRPARRIRDTISVRRRFGRRIRAAGGTTPEREQSRWPHTCTCTHEVSLITASVFIQEELRDWDLMCFSLQLLICCSFLSWWACRRRCSWACWLSPRSRAASWRDWLDSALTSGSRKETFMENQWEQRLDWSKEKRV